MERLMSLPSDVTPDAADAVDRVKPSAGRPTSGLTNEQIGLAAAAIAAFLGIAYFGPMLSRLTRPKPLRARMAQRVRDAQDRAWAFGKTTRDSGRKAGRRARKTVKRLGGGTIWR
jgi:hypothetical protein